MIVVELYNDVFDVEVSSSSLEVSVSQEAQVLDATVLKDTDALLQEKVVSINKNGETVITPDDGFDGMESVKVDAKIDPLSQCGYAEFDFVTYRRNYTIVQRLKRINFSCLDTSKVTSMNGMFSGCSSLTTLDVSNFDTSKVTSMTQMFGYCYSLTTLDVSGFDTSKVTGMNSMFVVCRSLTTLDVSGFDTSQVTSMNSMFNGCSSLTTLDVSGFDTSKVTGMNQMFYSCSSLTSIIGEKSLEDVENGTVAMKGTKVNLSISNSTKLRYSSMLALTKGLADLTGQKAQTISFSRNAWNNMFNDDDTIPTSDVIAERKATLSAIAASKNWNLSY